ncbi:MAG: tRNA lysidine(34) synthetase TilS [Leptolyngbyaceae bacterium]|nr:tRNA lysidine(34) synthetase TilS [Leptolyngbyaceae bacterium]
MTSPWTPLHAQLHQVLRCPPRSDWPTPSLLPKGQRILVAVSGGQDSLCLVKLLLDLQPHWDWTLAIAHCNHRWRADSDANADYVATLAQAWNLPIHTVTVEADQRGAIATEAGARTWRYQVLTDLAIAHQYAIVTTGHTASDRAETLLYNLMRGSGADGLQALTWGRSLHPTVQLVRPLLFMTRGETEQFCQDAGFKPWIDHTNNDWRYARNRIRQDLLPYLQANFNPRVERTLAQTAEILQADVAYLEAEAEKLWQQATAPDPASNSVGFQGSTPPASSPLSHPPTPQQINRTILANAPLALQRRVMRRWLLLILPTAPNFGQVDKLTALIAAPNRSQTDPFPGGAIAHIKGDWIIFNNPAHSR